MNAVEIVPLNKNVPIVYQCEAACTSNMFTFQSGSMTLDGYFHYQRHTSWKSLVSNLDNPLCNQCPVGAICSGNVKALSNYWGYRKMM